MMAELEIDQSNLPRVQEVCQCFAVLEDGALAHNLQEQEIEQYYTTNIQKNQLVQNDIRVAKRLQDEEEEEQAQQSTLFRQASRTLEEQDFEYARLIQEQLQRRAEEAQRREHDDEEIAKRMQEEEEHRLRRSSREQEVHSEGSASDTALPPTNQHSLSSLQRAEELYPSTTTRGQCSPSQTHSDLTEPRADCPRGEAAQHQNTTSRSNQGHTDSFREIRSKWRDILNEESEDSDSVFSESSSQRHNERCNTAPHRRWTSLHRPQERSYRSLGSSRRSFTDEQMNEERGERDEGYYENQDLERPRNSDQERHHRGEYEHRSRDQDEASRSVEVRREGRPCGRSESVQLHDRRNPGNRHLARTWSYKDHNNSDRRVHFGEDARSSSSSRPQQQQGSGGVWEMLGQVLRERGVAVRLGAGDGEAPLQILGPQSRDSQDVLHTGSQVSCGQDPQPHQRGFQRASTARHSFHGDIRERRRRSHRESSGRDHREDGDSQHYNNNLGCDGELYEITTTDSYYDNRAERGSGRRRERDGDRERNANDFGVRSTSSDGRRWHRSIAERLSSEEEQEAERRVERPQRRAPPQRSQSLSCSNGPSTRDRSRHMAAGASVQTEPGRASLDLGQLQQVLEDEELARTLQEEERRPLRRKSESSAVTCYPDGDFTVAQVAQDEEIARFMQKEEVKSKRRSRELEGPGSWREHRAMISHHDRKTARDRRVQRERLDSEGLPSPTEDCSPENQPPSPISTTPQAQQIRNIAEELDPTFQARRQGTESIRVAQTGPACQSLPTPQSGLPDFLEEPTFIPPTKRPTEKSAPARSKPKEKKENCKQQ